MTVMEMLTVSILTEVMNAGAKLVTKGMVSLTVQVCTYITKRKETVKAD